MGSLAEQVEVELIRADLQLLWEWIAEPRHAKDRSIFALSLIPHVAAVIVETRERVRQRHPDAVRQLAPYDALVRASRLRLKLLDESRHSLSELMADAKAATEFNTVQILEAMYPEATPEERAAMPDLGVYFMEGDVIGTTHTAFLNFAYSKEHLTENGLNFHRMPDDIRTVSAAYGGFIGTLSVILSLVPPSRPPGGTPAVAHFRRADVRSETLYAEMARRAAPGRPDLGLVLCMIAALVNTARHVVPALAGPSAVATFKWGLVTLYHAASGLQRLVSEHRRSGLLSLEAVALLQDALTEPRVRYLKGQKGLRNNLVHYSVRANVEPRLGVGRPLHGLVEAYVPGKTFDEVAADVRAGLDSTARALSELMPSWLVPQPWLVD